MSREAGQFHLLLRKDFLVLWRQPTQVVGTLTFSLLLIIVASFAFRQVGYGQSELIAVTPGIIWLTIVFSGVLSFNYSFLPEYDDRALLGVFRLSGAPVLVYLAKCFCNMCFLSCNALVIILSHMIFFGADITAHVPLIVCIALLVNIGFVSLGTLLAAVAAVHRERELILPLVLFPLIIPLFAGAVFLTQELLFTGTVDPASFWFIFVCCFDVISLVVSMVLFEHVVGI